VWYYSLSVYHTRNCYHSELFQSAFTRKIADYTVYHMEMEPVVENNTVDHVNWWNFTDEVSQWEGRCGQPFVKLLAKILQFADGVCRNVGTGGAQIFISSMKINAQLLSWSSHAKNIWPTSNSSQIASPSSKRTWPARNTVNVVTWLND